jgi:hypothetical protein
MLVAVVDTLVNSRILKTAPMERFAFLPIFGPVRIRQKNGGAVSLRPFDPKEEIYDARLAIHLPAD